MKLQGKNVLVSGGAGFIGSHLVDRIIQDNPARLVVVDNYFLGKDENLTEARKAYPDLKVVRMDAGDFSAMHQLVRAEEIQVVFDLAVIPLPTSLTFPAWTVHTNVSIATAFSELARCGYIETLIHCSSSEAYGSAQYAPMDEGHPLAATTPYAASKAAADQVVLSYIRTFGIDAAIVRPFNNFGPRQNAGAYAGIIPIVVNRVRSGEPIMIFGDGEQTRDYIFCRDTASALIQVYENENTRGLVINAGTGQEISVNALVKRLLEVMEKPNHPIIHTDPRPGDVRRHCADISLAQRLFGFSPAGTSPEYLKETVDWYLTQ